MDNKHLTGLISVIVPVYNVEQYLEQCVSSILNQTYTNLEILLVDDGSTDNSGSLCDALAKTDERIKVFHKQNGGLSDARNFALNQAQGDFIAYVDSDDYIGTKHLENLLSAILESCANVAITGCTTFVDGVDAPIEKNPTKPETRVMTSVEATNIAISPGLHPFAEHAWGKLFRADLAPYLIFPVGKYYEDIFIMHKVLHVAEKVVYVNANDYFYRRGRDSTLTKNISETFMDSIEACYEVKKYGESHAPDIAKQASKRYYGRLVRGFSLYSLQGDAINAGVVFKKIKQERWKALNSNAVALTTKIAFVLSYLGKPAFTQIAKFTQKLSNLREI